MTIHFIISLFYYFIILFFKDYFVKSLLKYHFFTTYYIVIWSHVYLNLFVFCYFIPLDLFLKFHWQRQPPWKKISRSPWQYGKSHWFSVIPPSFTPKNREVIAGPFRIYWLGGLPWKVVKWTKSKQSATNLWRSGGPSSICWLFWESCATPQKFVWDLKRCFFLERETHFLLRDMLGLGSVYIYVLFIYTYIYMYV